MTYDEIVDALRRARRMGDCVPEDIEGTAERIVRARVRASSHHVLVRDSKGVVLRTADTFPRSYADDSDATHIANIVCHVVRAAAEVVAGEWEWARYSHHWAMEHARWLELRARQP
jgi:hypothetical protein